MSACGKMKAMLKTDGVVLQHAPACEVRKFPHFIVFLGITVFMVCSRLVFDAVRYFGAAVQPIGLEEPSSLDERLRNHGHVLLDLSVQQYEYSLSTV